jgi:hypothetical protein
MNSKEFFYTDKTGRGFKGTFSEQSLLTWPDEIDDNEILISEFIQTSQIGDKWESRTDKIVRIK